MGAVVVVSLLLSERSVCLLYLPTTTTCSPLTKWSKSLYLQHYYNYYNHLTALCPGLPGWAGTRKVKPIWILLEQETVSGSGISWAICKSAPRSRQITTPVPHHLVFYRPDALPAAQPTVSKHWRQKYLSYLIIYLSPESRRKFQREVSLFQQISELA